MIGCLRAYALVNFIFWVGASFLDITLDILGHHFPGHHSTNDVLMALIFGVLFIVLSYEKKGT